jgi:hypothetical protein
MIDMNELREIARFADSVPNSLLREAADTIDRLRAELAKANPAWVKGAPKIHGTYMVWAMQKDWDIMCVSATEAMRWPGIVAHLPITRPDPPERT